MSNTSKPDVNYVKRKIERFYWENYQRDYQNDQSDLKTLYWHCALSDIIDYTKSPHAGSENEQRNQLATRLFRSYLSCFFEAHHLYHSHLDKFNGLSAFYRDEQHDIWRQWKQRVKKIRGEYFTLICESVKRNFENMQAITPNIKKVHYDIRAYDEWHNYLAQKVSSELSNHLHHGTLNRRQADTTNAVFLYDIETNFINVLNGYGFKYAKATMTYFVINTVDKCFEDGKKIIRTKKNLLPKERIKDAINDLLDRHPDLKQLDNSQLAYLIRLKYQDTNGNRLKRGSIKKALKRMDNSL